MTLASYLNPTPNTIWLKGEREAYQEARAAGAVKPGHCVELIAAGTVQVVGTAGKDTSFAIAVEDALQGLTINDGYSTGDLVRYVVCESGVEVQARLAAGATAVVIGDILTFSNDGTLKKATTEKVVAIAQQAVDNSGGGSEAFIGVMVK